MATRSPVKLAQVRAAFVADNMNLEQCSVVFGVPHGTLRNWKRKAKQNGDDWEKARAASLLAGQGLESVQKQMLAQYVAKQEAIIKEVLECDDVHPMDKTKALASLADSFTKIVSASRRVLPETDKLAVALQTMNILTEFVMQRFPQHSDALLEMVEPFGEELSRRLSNG